MDTTRYMNRIRTAVLTAAACMICSGASAGVPVEAGNELVADAVLPMLAVGVHPYTVMDTVSGMEFGRGNRPYFSRPAVIGARIGGTVVLPARIMTPSDHDPVYRAHGRGYRAVPSDSVSICGIAGVPVAVASERIVTPEGSPLAYYTDPSAVPALRPAGIREDHTRCYIIATDGTGEYDDDGVPGMTCRVIGIQDPALVPCGVEWWTDRTIGGVAVRSLPTDGGTITFEAIGIAVPADGGWTLVDTEGHRLSASPGPVTPASVAVPSRRKTAPAIHPTHKI